MEKKKFEYIEANEYQDFSVIKVSDVSGLISFAELNRIKHIFRITKDDGCEFFFSLNNVIYKIDGNGYSTLEDYNDAVSNKFPSAKDYYDAVKGGYTSFREFEESRKVGIDNKDNLMLARNAGFVEGYDSFLKKYEDYKSSKETNCISGDIDNAVKLYEYAKKKGFDDYTEFEKAYDNGFPDNMIYNEATSRGFKTGEDFFAAVKMGFDESKEFNDANRLMISSKKEYNDYLHFKNNVSDGLGFDEYQLIQILKPLENGLVLNIANIRKMLIKEQDRYKRKFEEEDMKVLPLWYVRKIETDDKLMDYLKSNEHAKKIVFYNGDKRIFEIFKVSMEKIYIDASNVAYHHQKGKELNAIMKNIKIVVDDLVTKGFKDITAIADASIKHHSKDLKILDKLRKRINYREVPSHTDADEFLIDNAKKDKCLIVSNDTFSDWKVKDKWIAFNIDYIRIPFMITNERVKFVGIEKYLQE